jgi:uncharacterized protein (TIGR02284 family)
MVWLACDNRSVTDEETIRHLNDLIAVARDGEAGYRAAAERVDADQLKSAFIEYAKQREGFVRDLQREVTRLGGVPNDAGTATGAIHRGWLDVKAAVTGGNPESVVAACETGEDSAAAAYERVVNLEPTGEPRAVIEKQWGQIKEAHARMLHLKKQLDETRS